MPSTAAPIIAQVQQEFQDLLTYVTGPASAAHTAYEVERTLFRRLLALGAALLRLFKGSAWVEAGATTEGKLQAMFMFNF